MITRNIRFKLFVLIVLVFAIDSCVPIRKQILVTDKNKKTLKEKQMMDTIVSMSPYEYRIRKGDILSVQIKSITPGEYKLDEVAMSGAEAEQGYVVDDSGRIDVPVIGIIKVGGYTIDECRDSLKHVASQYLNNVVVTVKFLSFEVAVVGELVGKVRSPDGKLTILQALAQTGWSKEYANIQKIKIIRELEGNKVHIYYIDVSDVTLITQPEFYLMPKDIIAVEPRKAKNFNNTRTLIAFGVSMLSVAFLIVNVVNILAN